MVPKRVDLTGLVFGRLTVIRFAGYTENHHSEWWVRCECGNRKIVEGQNLKAGRTVSCGCERKARCDAYHVQKEAKWKAERRSMLERELDLRGGWRKAFIKNHK